VDLTDVPLVTIDGEDARDFDDAVYCEPAKVGRGKPSRAGACWWPLPT
jgi:ribonuclease R